MRRLPDTVKRRIIERLACYHSHAEVVVLIEQEFGVRLTPRHIRAYDPSSFQFVGSRKWSEYFQIVRQRFVNEVGNIAIVHKSYRLGRIQEMLDVATDQGDFRLAMKLLEQAAKEVGRW